MTELLFFEEIDESSNVVIKYQSPSFNTAANVCFPAIAAYETWKVGWVQVCMYGGISVIACRL